MGAPKALSRNVFVFSVALPSIKEETQSLDRDSGGSIENDILPAAGARRDEGLVPLVKAGNHSSSEDGDGRPAKGPSEIPANLCELGQSLAEGAKEQETQEAVADYVSGFAEQEVPWFEILTADSEQKMENWIKESAGVMGGEPCRRFDRDYDQPKNGGNPRLEQVVRVAGGMSEWRLRLGGDSRM